MTSAEASTPLGMPVLLRARLYQLVVAHANDLAADPTVMASMLEAMTVGDVRLANERAIAALGRFDAEWAAESRAWLDGETVAPIAPADVQARCLCIRLDGFSATEGAEALRNLVRGFTVPRLRRAFKAGDGSPLATLKLVRNAFTRANDGGSEASPILAETARRLGAIAILDGLIQWSMRHRALADDVFAAILAEESSNE